MVESAKKKSSLNFLTSIIGQIIAIVLGIFIPRLFVLNYGSNVNGFISSINQIFVYVALLEAGVGTASLQALYLPVGQRNRENINSILSATHYFYKRTGFLYLAVITVIAFIYPLCIASTLSYFTMVIIILIIGGAGAFPYFFQAKYSILLNVDGRGYVLNIVNQIKSVLLSLCRIVLLLVGANVIFVETSYLVIGLLQTFTILIYMKKKYGWVDLHVKPNFQAISQRKSVLVHQFSTLIFSNTDILLLTFFCGLEIVSIYTIYKYLFGLIVTVINTFAGSVSFKLGQTFHDRDKFLRLHDVYETFHVSLTFALLTITFLFINPFLTLYTAGLDINYVLTYVPILFFTIELLDCGRVPLVNVITFAGHFKQTQWRSLLESSLNLVSSIIFIQFFGINGVLMGTVLALLYRMNDIIIYVNKRILERSPWHSYKLLLSNLCISAIVVFVFYTLNITMNNYFILIGIAAIITVILVPVYLIASYLINYKAGKDCIALIKQLLRNKKNNVSSDSSGGQV